MKALPARPLSVSTVSAARLWAWLLLSVLLVVGMGVRAQEVSRVFTAPNGTVHPTLKQAEAAMLAQYPDYRYLQNVSYANGKTYHNYTRGSGLPITSVWVDYDIAGSGGTYLTEDEAVVAMELGLLGTVNGHGYNCTGAKASPTSEWDRVQGWIKWSRHDGGAQLLRDLCWVLS